MNEAVIDYKLDEYIAKASAALAMRNYQRAKQAEKMVVILLRLQARAAIGKLVTASEELRTDERAVKMSPSHKNGHETWRKSGMIMAP